MEDRFYLAIRLLNLLLYFAFLSVEGSTTQASFGQTYMSISTAPSTQAQIPTSQTSFSPGFASGSTPRPTVNCSRGHYFFNYTDGCRQCDVGSYQELDNQTYCEPCGNGTSTRQPASDSPDLCIAYCAAGEEMRGGSCEACKQGWWNSGNESQRFDPCLPCPQDLTTASEGATGSDNCTLNNCRPGTYINNNGAGCSVCGIGTYQPRYNQIRCTTCPPASTTSTPGATSLSNCTTIPGTKTSVSMRLNYAVVAICTTELVRNVKHRLEAQIVEVSSGWPDLCTDQSCSNAQVDAWCGQSQAVIAVVAVSQLPAILVSESSNEVLTPNNFLQSAANTTFDLTDYGLTLLDTVVSPAQISCVGGYVLSGDVCERLAGNTELSAGLIGSMTGGAVVIAALVVLAIFICRKTRQRRLDNERKGNDDSGPGKDFNDADSGEYVYPGYDYLDNIGDYHPLHLAAKSYRAPYQHLPPTVYTPTLVLAPALPARAAHISMGVGGRVGTQSSGQVTHNRHGLTTDTGHRMLDWKKAGKDRHKPSTFGGDSIEPPRPHKTNLTQDYLLPVSESIMAAGIKKRAKDDPPLPSVLREERGRSRAANDYLSLCDDGDANDYLSPTTENPLTKGAQVQLKVTANQNGVEVEQRNKLFPRSTQEYMDYRTGEGDQTSSSDHTRHVSKDETKRGQEAGKQGNMAMSGDNTNAGQDKTRTLLAKPGHQQAVTGAGRGLGQRDHAINRVPDGQAFPQRLSAAMFIPPADYD